jgi:hypothetical protein
MSSRFKRSIAGCQFSYPISGLYIDMKARAKRLLERIRKWVDGVSDTSIPEPKPRPPAEELLVEISRKIDAVMYNELLRTPNGPTQLPGRFIVLFNRESCKSWTVGKRKAFEQTLTNIVSERARQLSKPAPLAVESFIIQLIEDSNLDDGEIRVEAVWDDGSGVPAGTELTGPHSRAETSILRVPTTQTFAVEVWQGKKRLTSFSFAKAEITIGRGSESEAVDVPIRGYQEVSRTHATLKFEEKTNTFWLIARGRNPTLVSGQRITANQPVQITSKDKIEISRLTLYIKPTIDAAKG